MVCGLVGMADIAYGGDAGPNSLARSIGDDFSQVRLATRSGGDQLRNPANKVTIKGDLAGQSGKFQMGMGVDQARQQRTVGKIKLFSVGELLLNLPIWAASCDHTVINRDSRIANDRSTHGKDCCGM